MLLKTFTRLLLCAVLGSTPAIVAAQGQSHAATKGTITASGVVMDADGPVIGATIMEKGTGNGTSTDFDGKFSIKVAQGATLVVSYVGAQTQEVKAAADMTINLKEDSKTLGEVVVTALGIKRERKALGYGLDEVKGEAFAKAKETNVINSMAGRVPGLVVQNTAGGPAGSSRVILRGTTEMTGNNQPLYVIDGVPMDNTNFGSAGTEGGYDLGDGISSLNSDDIETMSVLKGPAASALYGSRASHGVILITTKKAAKDTWSVEYNGTLTFDTQLAKWNNLQQIYGMGSNGLYSIDARSNTNKSWGPKADGTNMLKYYDGVERPYLIIPNNTGNFFRTGLTATNTVVVSSSNGKTGVRFTFTDLRNKDIVPNTGMNRDVFNLRANTSLGKVDLDFTANYTHEYVKNRPALGNSKNNVGKNLMTLATTYNQDWLRTYEDINGNYANWNGNDPYNTNPYWDVYKNSNISKKDLFRLNGRVIYNVTDHLKFQGTVGAEITNFNFEDFKAPTTPGYESGYMQRSQFNNQMYNAEIMGIYNNSWGDYSFTGTFGGNLYKVDNKTTLLTAKDMTIRDVVALMSFNDKSTEEESWRKQIVSGFAAANFGWRNMLYLDATVRCDKSSTLPIKNNIYVYPSFSASWLFSELIKAGSAMPYGKLRLSWAQVGSDTNPYQLGLTYGKSKFSYPGYTIGSINNTTLPNQDLKPTMTNSFECGLEMKFLNYRMGLDFTFYTQNSRNQIIGLASSGASGYPYRLINAGEIENTGIEIALNTRPVVAGDFTWDLNINFSKNNNKVKKLVDDVQLFELEKAQWCNVMVAAQVGENYGAIMGNDFLRNENGDILIDPSTGLPKYTDTYKVLGNASWDWTGGLLTTLTWKNLSLTAIFDAKFGADLFSMSARGVYESGKAMETLAGREEWYKSEEKRMELGYAKNDPNWTPTGGFIAPGVLDDGNDTPNNIIINPEDYWMFVTRNIATPFIYDNSYVKCREITLAYTFPTEWFKNKIKGMSISFVARNPFIVWKNIPNIDPDSNYNNTTGMGLEYGSLPSRKSFGFNVNVKF
ncbi:MAG: SusC/RagA family TonB-linked outer membrane protein [Muribaculaceae bacterium]|nr:SusC/RagA family TonB-linked outer membrane protein [Muribaculaceae bacterium]